LLVATGKKVQVIKREKLPAINRRAKIAAPSFVENVVTSKSRMKKAEVTNEKPKHTLNLTSARSVGRRTDKKGIKGNTRARGGKRCK